MLPILPFILPFIEVLTAILSCYLAGFAIAGLISSRRSATPALSEAQTLANQLQLEIRDAVSQELLAMIETDQEVSLTNLVDRCPDGLRSDRTWAIWMQESYQMLRQFSSF